MFKAMGKKPQGESRIPTDYWSGLGFSKSMPDHAIRERLRASGVKYQGPTMETTYEVHINNISVRNAHVNLILIWTVFSSDTISHWLRAFKHSHWLSKQHKHYFLCYSHTALNIHYFCHRTETASSRRWKRRTATPGRTRPSPVPATASMPDSDSNAVSRRHTRRPAPLLRTPRSRPCTRPSTRPRGQVRTLMTPVSRLARA